MMNVKNTLLITSEKTLKSSKKMLYNTTKTLIQCCQSFCFIYTSYTTAKIKCCTLCKVFSISTNIQKFLQCKLSSAAPSPQKKVWQKVGEILSKSRVELIGLFI